MTQDIDKECLLIGIARVVGFLRGKPASAQMASMLTARYPYWRKSRWVAAQRTYVVSVTRRRALVKEHVAEFYRAFSFISSFGGGNYAKASESGRCQQFSFSTGWADCDML
jgi:hypothetical protein